MSWSPQKPKRRARERNEDAIAIGKTSLFPPSWDAAMAHHAHVVFLDESGLMPTPTVRRMWAPQGQTPELSSWDERGKHQDFGKRLQNLAPFHPGPNRLTSQPHWRR